MSNSDPNPEIGSRPLHEVIPDLDQLLANPASYLAQRPVTISQPRLEFRYWLLTFLLIPVMIFLYWELRPHIGSGSYWALLFMGLFVITAMINKIWPVDCQLVLTQTGVEFHYRKTVVWCPWTLFNADGEVFINTDALDINLVLPVAPAAIPLVEHRRPGKIISRGNAIRSGQLWFPSDDNVEIPDLYETSPRELGNLLLRLGRKLGESQQEPKPLESAWPEEVPDTRITPVVPSPGSATDTAITRSVDAGSYASPNLPDTDRPAPRVVTIDAEGWITFPVNRVQFPPCCCNCCQLATHNREYVVPADVGWPLRLLHLGFLRIMIPWCSSCLIRQSVWYLQRCLYHAGVGALFGMLLHVVFVCLGEFGLTGKADIGAGFCVAFFTALIGLCVGIIRGKPEPFQGRYNATTHKVSFFFPNGQFREKVLTQGLPKTDDSF